MPKTLIIAEKPSVAADLAKALAKAPNMTSFEKEKDYFENNTHIITSAIGHLVEICMPEVDGKKIGWTFKNLPILPDAFELKPIDKTADRFKLLLKFLKNKDVTEIINACDAGREGELIFRYIMDATGIKKPIKRMWMQSMTQGSILEAFGKLRRDEEMLPLADAAKCRSESDWLIGINGTRAMTNLNSAAGGFRLTPVGRVQTPTLSILAKREVEIQNFVTSTYFEVHALFNVHAGEYEGRWFNENFDKDKAKEHDKAERLWNQADADAILARCKGQPATIEQVTKPTKQASPLLYDLTSLQREANNRFGFPARRTLQVAQALYEKYKVLTYPRTDSRHLPEDYLGTVKSTLKNIANAGSKLNDISNHASHLLDQNWVKPNRRIFDNSKVSDHFAIIPTGQIPKDLPEAEQKIFDLVTRRFIAVFYPPAEFEVTSRITRILKDAFKTEGKILITPGWLAVYGKKGYATSADDSENDRILVPIQPQEKAHTKDILCQENQTKPPARFNEATLLSTMEGAGKLVDDEELAEAMSERGLGTPATRAAIIEGLIYDSYVERIGREFHVNPKGLRLIEQIHHIGIDMLGSPELTGNWEHRLRLMEQNKLKRADFMADIKKTTSELVDKTKNFSKNYKEKVLEPFTAKCAFCGHTTFKQTEETLSCEGAKCKVKIPKQLAGRKFEEAELRRLIETCKLGPLENLRSKRGKSFTATLIIDDKQKTQLLYPEGSIDPDSFNWDECPVITACPTCAKKGLTSLIYDTPDGYLCRNAAPDIKKCNSKLPKALCKKDITPEHAKRFFEEGSTGVINGMISKKGRPFNAILNFKPEEKKSIINWTFAPREPSAKKATTKRSKFAKKAAPES